MQNHQLEYSEFMLNTPMDEKTFKKFLAGEITVKEAKTYTEIVGKRFSYIVHKIAEMAEITVSWFDYDNESEYEQGEFDTDSYQNMVSYTAEYHYVNNKSGFDKYENYFPTAWFYTNFETQLEKEKQEFLQSKTVKQQQENAAKLKAKEEFEKVKDKIKKKLSLEELAYISFLPIEEVRKNQYKADTKVTQQISKELALFIKEMKQKGVNVSEYYKEYRDSKKKPKDFNSWVMKNLDKLRNKANAKTVVIPPTAWPFPTNKEN